MSTRLLVLLILALAVHTTSFPAEVQHKSPNGHFGKHKPSIGKPPSFEDNPKAPYGGKHPKRVPILPPKHKTPQEEPFPKGKSPRGGKAPKENGGKFPPHQHKLQPHHGHFPGHPPVVESIKDSHVKKLPHKPSMEN